MAWDTCKFHFRVIELAELIIGDLDAARADCAIAIVLIANPKFAPILTKGTML